MNEKFGEGIRGVRGERFELVIMNELAIKSINSLSNMKLKKEEHKLNKGRTQN